MPSGKTELECLPFRIASAKANDTGPTRPANIANVSASLEAIFNVGVMPVVKPVVLNAETDSNSDAKNPTL